MKSNNNPHGLPNPICAKKEGKKRSKLLTHLLDWYTFLKPFVNLLIFIITEIA